MENNDNLTLRNTDNKEILLASLWQSKTAVLLFLRHFGCSMCAKQISEIEPYVQKIQSLGANIVAIGSGTIIQGIQFKKKYDISMEILVDPFLESYRLFKLKKSILASIGPRTWKSYWKALRAGFGLASGKKGSPWQMGGVIIIDAKGKLIFQHISQVAGDHPDPADIMNHLT